MMHGPWHMMHGGWQEAVWTLSTLLIWIFLLVVAGRVLVRMTRRPPPERPDALSVLEERYARGEIDRDEFMERRRVLLESQPP